MGSLRNMLELHRRWNSPRPGIPRPQQPTPLELLEQALDNKVAGVEGHAHQAPPAAKPFTQEQRVRLEVPWPEGPSGTHGGAHAPSGGGRGLLRRLYARRR
jgi:hypothetical protein